MKLMTGCFAVSVAAIAVGMQANNADPALSVEGVCSVEPGAVTCWDMAGKDRPDLAERLKKRYEDRNRPVFTVFGLKNRYLVIKKDSAATREGVVYKSAVHEDEGDILRISVPTDTTTINLGVAINLPPKPATKLTPKKGATAKIDGQEVKITKIVKAVGGSAGLGVIQDAKSPTWRLYLTHKSTDLSKLRALATRKEGSFSFVDSDGNPISGITAPSNKKPAVAAMRLMRPLNDSEWYIDTNINPSKLTAIELAQPTTREFTISNIPLDPKKLR